MITTAEFWRGAAERALKTAMQVFVALVVVQAGTGLVPEVGITALDWGHVASVTGLAVVLSLATSLGNARFTAGVPADPNHDIGTDEPTPMVWPPLDEEQKWGPHLTEHPDDVYTGVENRDGTWSDVHRVYKGSTGEHLLFEPVGARYLDEDGDGVPDYADDGEVSEPGGTWPPEGPVEVIPEGQR